MGGAPVRMFYQVWDKPLYTLNGGHIVSDAIRLCGGVNIYAHVKITAPVVSVEAVLQEDPEALISSGEISAEEGGVGIWKPAFPWSAWTPRFLQNLQTPFKRHWAVPHRDPLG